MVKMKKLSEVFKEELFTENEKKLMEGIAKYIKTKKNLPYFSEAVEYSSLTRRECSGAEDHLSDMGVLNTVIHRKKGVFSRAFYLEIPISDEFSKKILGGVTEKEIYGVYTKIYNKAKKSTKNKDFLAEYELMMSETVWK